MKINKLQHPAATLDRCYTVVLKEMHKQPLSGLS